MDISIIFGKVIINFWLNELAQINIIYLPPTPRVPDGEKFMDKALQSIDVKIWKDKNITADC